MKFFLVNLQHKIGVEDTFHYISANVACTITSDKKLSLSPIWILGVLQKPKFLPLNPGERKQRRLRTPPFKEKKSLFFNKSFSCQSLKTPFIGFVIVPVMCIRNQIQLCLELDYDNVFLSESFWKWNTSVQEKKQNKLGLSWIKLSPNLIKF